MRLDAFLAQKYPETSRAIFQKLIEAGRVEVNNQPAKSARQEIAAADIVKVHFPRQKNFTREIADFAKNVIYEDDNVVVINKPAGVLTHMKGSLADEFTVADFVRSRILKSSVIPSAAEKSLLEQQDSSTAESDESNSSAQNDRSDDFFSKSNRPGIIHRLDRATSGVMIAAKNPETAKFLTKQFACRKAKKTYLALTAKAPKIPAARIDLPIGRNPKKPAEFRVDSKGKSAITDYQTLEVFDDGSALIELKPQTGRTHQLRVHLAHIGAPIVGDIVYGRAQENQRMMLHAVALEITIPAATDNERKTFSADLPDDFESEIESKRKSR